MKLAFSDKHISCNSFLELCNLTRDYGFDGFEISDAEVEKSSHTDSIFKPNCTADAKRKLINRHIAITALGCPERISDNADGEKIAKYVEYASTVLAKGVVLRFDSIPLEEKLKEILRIEIITADERCSTCEAEEILISQGKSREERKSVVDSLAAATILQSYLNEINKNAK